uniref:RNase H domain-containing protein n=1 Tax=Heterorhabditis bacteriophora TaxID=37862 RepID=A0A1I7WW72_HETBA
MSLRKEAIHIRIVGDSKVALCWLKTSRSLPVFVRNQVKRKMKIREELLKLSKSVTFHYIPSEFNPSDTGTRGCKGNELLSTLWLNCPTWCNLESKSWPITNLDKISSEKAEEEIHTTTTCPHS